jgi:hypothetical protein
MLGYISQVLHEFHNVSVQSSLVIWQAFLVYLALHVVVHVFHWVKFWRVGRQIEYFDLILVCLLPGNHLRRLVRLQSIRDQEDLSGCALNQFAQEHQLGIGDILEHFIPGAPPDATTDVAQPQSQAGVRRSTRDKME